MSKIVLISIFTLLSSLTTTSSAVNYFSPNLYQVEIDANSTLRNFTGADSKTYLINADFYFEEVQPLSHPYAEVAFLERASSLGLGYYKADYTFANDVDETGGILTINYNFEESPIFYDIFLSTFNGDYNSEIYANYDLDISGIGFGFYLNDHSAVELNYFKYHYTYEINQVTFVSINDHLISLKYKWVKELNSDKGINFEIYAEQFENTQFTSTSYLDADQTITDTNHTLEISADYYFTQSLSVGASLGKLASDNIFNEGTIGGIRANMFFTPFFSVYGEFSKFSADNIFGEDSEEYILGAMARY